MKHPYKVSLASLLLSIVITPLANAARDDYVDSRGLGYLDKCIDLFSIDDNENKENIASIFSYDDQGNINSTAYAIVKRNSTKCFKFGDLGYYKVLFSGEEGRSYNISIINNKVPLNFQMGVVTHFGNLSQSTNILKTIQLLKAAGIGWVRDELSWQNVEKKKGIFEFPAQYDTYVNTLRAEGLKTLIVLDYGNNNYGGTKNIKSSIQPFANYAENVVMKYGDYINHWEVWNEPKPSQFGDRGWDTYAQLLSSVYSRIKSVQKNSVVIGCGGGGAGGGPGGDCIQAVARQYNGDISDAYSIHPYLTHSPESGYQALNSPFKGLGGYINIRTVTKMLKPFYDKTKKSIYITEIGWPSSSENKRFSDSQQAAYVLRTYLLVRQGDLFPVVFWYDFRDDGIDKNNKEHNFGMLKNDYTPKMSYIAVSNMNSLLYKYKWVRNIIDGDGVIVSEFSDETNLIQVGWSYDNKTHVIPTDKRTRYIVDWQGKKTQSMNGNWKLSEMPSYRILNQ